MWYFFPVRERSVFYVSLKIAFKEKSLVKSHRDFCKAVEFLSALVIPWIAFCLFASFTCGGIWVEKAKEERRLGRTKMSRGRTAGEADVFLAGCRVREGLSAGVCFEGSRLWSWGLSSACAAGGSFQKQALASVRREGEGEQELLSWNSCCGFPAGKDGGFPAGCCHILYFRILSNEKWIALIGVIVNS